jgi:hypothetical protein
LDFDKHIEAFLNEADDTFAGIDTYVPKHWSAWAVLSVIGTVAGLLGVVTLVQGVIVPFFGLKVVEIAGQNILVEHVAFVVALLLSIAGFTLILTYFLWLLSDAQGRLRNLRGKYISLLTQSSPIFQELRSHSFVLTNISKVASLLKELLDAAPQTGAGTSKTVGIILSDIQSVFDRITDDTCSVCIKILTVDDGRLDVSTWVRDSRSAAERNYVDRLDGTQRFDAYANTAFREIIDPRSGKHHFVSNDLKELAALGKYQNANPNWSEHYNAAIVVPIARAESVVALATDGAQIEGFLGFLCVDNLKGNFDRQVCLPILNTYASILQILLQVDRIIEDSSSILSEVKDDKKTSEVEEKSGRRRGRRKSARGSRS